MCVLVDIVTSGPWNFQSLQLLVENFRPKGFFLTWRIKDFIKTVIHIFKKIWFTKTWLLMICFHSLPFAGNHTQSSFLDLSRFPVLIPLSSFSHSLSLKLIAATLKLTGIIIEKTTPLTSSFPWVYFYDSSEGYLAFILQSLLKPHFFILGPGRCGLLKTYEAQMSLCCFISTYKLVLQLLPLLTCLCSQ